MHESAKDEYHFTGTLPAVSFSSGDIRSGGCVFRWSIWEVLQQRDAEVQQVGC